MSKLITILLALGLMSFSAFASPAPATGKTFTFRLTAEPETLDWTKAHTTVECYVLMNLMEGLVGYDSKMKPVPALAKSWTIGPDGKTYTFKLRSGVKWSDGVPLKASDFVFSWSRLLSPATGAAYAYFLFDIEGAEDFNKGKSKDFASVGVKATDDSTLVVKLVRPIAHWIHMPTFWGTFPLREDIVKKYGSSWAKPGKMVTVGPFTLAAHDSDSKVVMKANPTYYGGKLGIDEAVGQIVKDDSTALTLYETGKLDFVTEIPNLDLERLKGRPDLKSFAYLKTGYLAFTTQKGPVTNAKLRRAIALAIDKKKLVSLIPGFSAGGSFAPPPMVASNAAAGLKFDVAKAKSELKASGVDPAALSLELLVQNADRPLLIAQFIQDQLKKNLGITVTLQPFDHKTFRSQLDLNAAPMFINTWGADYPDPDNFYSVFLSDSGNNKAQFKSKAYDEKVLSARGTLAQAPRVKLYKDAEKILLEDEAAVLPLFYQPNMALVRPGVNGLELDPLNYLWIKKVKLGGR